MSALTSWVLSIALLVHDGHGFTKRMPVAMAEAIDAAATANPFDGDIRYTAALLTVFAFRESSYRSDVEGDCDASKTHCHSAGAWQTPAGSTSHDVAKQAVYALKLMHESAEKCESAPLAVYAGGCGNSQARRISTVRMALAHELAVTP